jgi:hypothetical protein
MAAEPNITGTANWPVPNAATLGPVSTSVVGPDRHQPRLPYRRVGTKTDDPLMRNSPRVIIPHNGKSFAAPPL